MGKDFPEIYLQAAGDADHAGDGRLWCQHDVWSDEPGNSAPTKYIRSDLHDAAQARIAELEAALREARSEVARRAGCMNEIGVIASQARLTWGEGTYGKYLERIRFLCEPPAALTQENRP